MKATEINVLNVSMSVLYCFFGILSFFVLKVTIKYFSSHKQNNTLSDAQMKNIKEIDSLQLNFSKLYLKSYFLKNTLVGSIFFTDKKYLLKQLFILSCIAVSCFKINSIIVWPWLVALCAFVAVQIGFEVLIPLFSREAFAKIDGYKIQQQSNNIDEVNSMQIQHTNLQISASDQKSLNSKQQGKKQEQKAKTNKFELIFILVLAFLTEILICLCALSLSLSSSNSGYLNIISLSIVVFIDQIFIRVGLGLCSYLILYIFNSAQIINFTQNRYLISFCMTEMNAELEAIEKNIKIKNNKITNSNFEKTESKNQLIRQQSNFQDATGDKLIFQNKQADQQVIQVNKGICEEGLKDEAIMEEPQDQENQKKCQNKISIPYGSVVETIQNTQNQSVQKECEQTDSKIRTKSIKKAKKIQDFKQIYKKDRLLYFPYEQNKLSHRASTKCQLKQNQSEMSSQFQKASISQNYLNSIYVVDCIQDSMNSQEQSHEPEIGAVLHETNLNTQLIKINNPFKTLINQQAKIQPTYRASSAIKKGKPAGHAKSLSKLQRQSSPYLVNLESEAIRPKNLKKSKANKQVNKQNANQINSFEDSQCIQNSRFSKKVANSRKNSLHTIVNENKFSIQR